MSPPQLLDTKELVSGRQPTLKRDRFGLIFQHVHICLPPDELSRCDVVDYFEIFVQRKTMKNWQILSVTMFHLFSIFV